MWKLQIFLELDSALSSGTVHKTYLVEVKINNNFGDETTSEGELWLSNEKLVSVIDSWSHTG